MAAPVVAGAAALMVQKDPTLTPDTIKARMMLDAWKGYPVRATSSAHDVLNHFYISQYDAFTIGAGYLDIQATLGDNTVVSGGAASPTVVFNAVTDTATLANGISAVYGSTVVWGSSTVWADSVVWGQFTVDGSSVVWGNSVVWGQATTSACTTIWGQSVVWGQLDSPTADAISDPDAY